MAKAKTVSINWLYVIIAFIGALILIYVVNNYQQAKKTGAAPRDYQITGSGAPNGPHYNLNIIGVPKGKTADMTGSQGHRIFVPLTGNAKISLFEGDDFMVIDANGTDGRASFQLPNPDPENDGLTQYSVWARPLGKPGGKSTTTTCATDVDGTEWCSIYNMVLVREKGKSSFTDVSKQLLYIYADLDLDGSVERYPLFDPALQDYFWNYDNQGMKIVQLRFYQVVSQVPAQ